MMLFEVVFPLVFVYIVAALPATWVNDALVRYMRRHGSDDHPVTQFIDQIERVEHWSAAFTRILLWPIALLCFGIVAIAVALHRRRVARRFNATAADLAPLGDAHEKMKGAGVTMLSVIVTVNGTMKSVSWMRKHGLEELLNDHETSVAAFFAEVAGEHAAAPPPLSPSLTPALQGRVFLARVFDDGKAMPMICHFPKSADDFMYLPTFANAEEAVTIMRDSVGMDIAAANLTACMIRDVPFFVTSVPANAMVPRSGKIVPVKIIGNIRPAEHRPDGRLWLWDEYVTLNDLPSQPITKTITMH